MVRGGGGRGTFRGLIQIVGGQRGQAVPIEISSSETSDESEEDEEDHFGFGRCFRCGELGSESILYLHIITFLLQVSVATGSETALTRISKVRKLI